MATQLSPTSSVMLAYSQVPVLVKDMFGTPNSYFLADSDQLRPSAQFLLDIGRNLVEEQFSRADKATLQRGQKRAWEADEEQSNDSSEIDSVMLLSDGEETGKDEAPTEEARTPKVKINFSERREERKMIVDSVQRLRWKPEDMKYRCPTCKFQADAGFLMADHLDAGHVMWNEARQLHFVTCAYKHKYRMKFETIRSYQSHMLKQHKIQVPQEAIIFAIPPRKTYKCSLCLYASTERVERDHHSRVCRQMTDIKGLLKPDFCDPTWVFCIDGSNRIRLRGTLLMKSKHQPARQDRKSPIIINTRFLNDSNTVVHPVSKSSLDQVLLPPARTVPIRPPARLVSVARPIGSLTASQLLRNKNPVFNAPPRSSWLHHRGGRVLPSILAGPRRMVPVRVMNLDSAFPGLRLQRLQMLQKTPEGSPYPRPLAPVPVVVAPRPPAAEEDDPIYIPEEPITISEESRRPVTRSRTGCAKRRRLSPGIDDGEEKPASGEEAAPVAVAAQPAAETAETRERGRLNADKKMVSVRSHVAEETEELIVGGDAAGQGKNRSRTPNAANVRILSAGEKSGVTIVSAVEAAGVGSVAAVEDVGIVCEPEEEIEEASSPATSGEEKEEAETAGKEGSVAQSRMVFVCELCNGLCRDFEALKKHWQYRHAYRHGRRDAPGKDEKPKFACSDCGKAFWTQQGEALHRKNLGCEIGMRCPFCSGVFMKEAIYFHLALHHEHHFLTMQKKGYCLLCDNGDDHPLQLSEHWLEAHDLRLLEWRDTHGHKVHFFLPACDDLDTVIAEPEREAEPPVFKCPSCEDTFPSRTILRDHLIHSGHRLSCWAPGCEQTFVDKFSLTSHLTVDHVGLSCQKCDKFTTDSPWKLRQHLCTAHGAAAGAQLPC